MKGRPALRICSCNSLRAQVFENYGTTRFDSFHQLTYPNTYFGWLSIVPRVGYRGTYYGKTWDLGSTTFVPPSNPLEPDFILPRLRRSLTQLSSTETHSALFSTQVQKPRSRSRAHGKTCKAGRSVWMGLCTSFNRSRTFLM